MSAKRYSQLYLDSLKENQPELYAALEAKGQLRQIADEIGERAQSQFENLLAQLQRENPLPTNPVDRVTALHGLESQANELVMAELLVRDEETEAAEVHGYVDREPPGRLSLQTLATSSPASATNRLRNPRSQ